VTNPPRLSKKRVEEYAQRFASTRISVLGDVMLDRYFWGDVDRISPEAPVPVVRVTKRSERLGGAANVAANLRELGVEVKIAGVVGDDREAGEVRRPLDEFGIDAGGMVAVAGRETTEKVRIIARSQQVVRADFEADDGIGGEAKGRLFEAVRAHADDCSALLISDYGKGVITEDYLRELIAVWRDKGKPVLVDPHVGHFPWYRRASIITPNVKEALRGSSLPPGTKDITSAGAFRICDELELDALLVTRGEHGMSLYHGDGEGRREVHIPTVAKEVYDVTGAGDTVIGVLAAGMGAGVGVVDAVVLANQAAGEVVKEVGTSAVTRESLLNAFEDSDA
jgi:D-beta-D-heptose 7-phosphate kinase/D-beta-D-heptose 1-phosphate adenosyltransferase